MNRMTPRIAAIALAAVAGGSRQAIARPQDEVKVQVKRADAPVAARARKAEAVDIGAMLKAAVANFRGEPIAPAQAALLAPDVDLGPQARQIAAQFRPFLLAELRTVRSSCDPSAEQRRAIAIDGLKALEAVGRSVAEAQNGIRMGNFRETMQPRQRIRDAVVASARTHLSAEQRARYLGEREKRDEDLREAVIANLVVKVDAALVLSPDQQRRLRQALRASDRPGALPTPEVMAAYDAYFPAMLHPFVAPILDESQGRIWAGLQKIDFSRFMDTSFLNSGEEMDPDDEAELQGETAPTRPEGKE